MNEPGIVEKKPIVLPCIAGILCILSLFLIGLAAPVFMTMFRDFGLDPLPPHLSVISHIHWLWTLPLGILVAAGLIWSSRHWSRKTTVAVNLLAMALAILVFIAFCFVAFRPIFFPTGIIHTAGSGSSGDSSNTWQEVLSRVTIPAIDLREVSWGDAIGQFNRLISEADTNGTAPTLIVDQSPPKVVVTNATGSHALDKHVEALIARFKQRHASSLNPEPRPVTFTARHIPAMQAIKIVASVAGVGLWDRAGKPIVGYGPDWFLVCRAYPWSAVQSKAVSAMGVEGRPGANHPAWEIKPGLEGTDKLEMLFSNGFLPLPYTMMIVPDTSLVLVLGTQGFQDEFGRILPELSGLDAQTR